MRFFASIFIVMSIPLLFFSCSPLLNEADLPEEWQDVNYTYSTQEEWCQKGNMRIYGELYLPDSVQNPLPLLVFSHGFGGSHTNGSNYARAMAQKGFAVYCFDFCGATKSSKSDGETTDMSIRTEEADLHAVVEHFKRDSRIDASHIYLAGASQGGMVSAMMAADYPDDIRAMVLIYPAFVIPDDVHEWYPDRNNIDETFTLWGVKLGRIYVTDAYDYDVYAEIGHFTKPVLIIHGTDDNIVPVSYSQRAAEVYPDAELKIIEGAGHGFYGSDQTQATTWLTEFLLRQNNR